MQAANLYQTCHRANQIIKYTASVYFIRVFSGKYMGYEPFFHILICLFKFWVSIDLQHIQPFTFQRQGMNNQDNLFNYSFFQHTHACISYLLGVCEMYNAQLLCQMSGILRLKANKYQQTITWLVYSILWRHIISTIPTISATAS